MLEYFSDWQNRTGDFEVKSHTKDAQGRTVEVWTPTHTDVKVNYWTDSSFETNVNDKFVDRATGRILVSPALFTGVPKNTITNYRFVSDGLEHLIIGADDVAEFGDVEVLRWVREYA